MREKSAAGLFLIALLKNGYCRFADRTARLALLFSPDVGDGAGSNYTDTLLLLPSSIRVSGGESCLLKMTD